MQCKVFTLPIESQALGEGERRLNDFLKAARVRRVFASVAESRGGAWSVMVFYNEASAATPAFAPPAEAHVEPPLPPQSNLAAARAVAPSAAGPPPDPGPPLTAEQVKWIIALKRWRADQAAQEGVPLYMVAHNKCLEEIVRMPARGERDLLKIRGMGEWRVKKYGLKILELLSAAHGSNGNFGGTQASAAAMT